MTLNWGLIAAPKPPLGEQNGKQTYYELGTTKALDEISHSRGHFVNIKKPARGDRRPDRASRPSSPLPSTLTPWRPRRQKANSYR